MVHRVSDGGKYVCMVYNYVSQHLESKWTMVRVTNNHPGMQSLYFLCLVVKSAVTRLCSIIWRVQCLLHILEIKCSYNMNTEAHVQIQIQNTKMFI